MQATKRIVNIFLAVMLMATMLVVPASANGSYSITITNTTENHTFTAYQIFSGDLAAGILSNVEWGNGVDGDGLLAALKANEVFGVGSENIFSSCTDAATLATILEASVKTVQATDQFAKVVAEHLDFESGYGSFDSSDMEYTISGLDAGYYIVVDSGLGEVDDATSKYIVQVSSTDPDVKVAVKMDIPTMVKTVSRTIGATYTEAISASYNDTVYFKLEGKMHSRLEDYDKYYYQVVDTLPDGLTFNQIESVVILNGTTSNEVDNTGSQEYTVDVDSDTITITFDDIKSTIWNATNTAAVADDYVVIKYSATVNDGLDDSDIANTPAVVGSAGNKNVVKLIYSSDPNHPENHDTTTATTKEDTAYVYCYKVLIDKVDGTNAGLKLEDAVFILHRVNGTTTEYAQIDEDGRLSGWSTTEDGASPLITDSNGAVSVIGLASGTYYLKEKTPPAGYNTLEDTISVTINATSNAATGALDTLTANTTHGGSAVTDKEAGSVTVTIGNNKGATLPSTGGMGTTIFYIAGISLVVSAGAVLLTRKRKDESA